MDEDFSRQTRRFSAAILTYGKGNRRSMAGKRPARRRAAVVNTGSKSFGRFLESGRSRVEQWSCSGALVASSVLLN
jgi:hypothetical protein